MLRTACLLLSNIPMPSRMIGAMILPNAHEPAGPPLPALHIASGRITRLLPFPTARHQVVSQPPNCYKPIATSAQDPPRAAPKKKTYPRSFISTRGRLCPVFGSPCSAIGTPLSPKECAFIQSGLPYCQAILRRHVVVHSGAPLQGGPPAHVLHCRLGDGGFPY